MNSIANEMRKNAIAKLIDENAKEKAKKSMAVACAKAEKAGFIVEYHLTEKNNK